MGRPVCNACIAHNMERLLQMCDVQVLGMNCMAPYIFHGPIAYYVYRVFS